MTEERLDWIERWLTEQKDALDRRGSRSMDHPRFYADLPLSCTVEMGLELVAALKDAE